MRGRAGLEQGSANGQEQREWVSARSMSKDKDKERRNMHAKKNTLHYTSSLPTEARYGTLPV